MPVGTVCSASGQRFLSHSRRLFHFASSTRRGPSDAAAPPDARHGSAPPRPPRAPTSTALPASCRARGFESVTFLRTAPCGGGGRRVGTSLSLTPRARSSRTCESQLHSVVARRAVVVRATQRLAPPSHRQPVRCLACRAVCGASRRFVSWRRDVADAWSGRAPRCYRRRSSDLPHYSSPSSVLPSRWVPTDGHAPLARSRGGRSDRARAAASTR